MILISLSSNQARILFQHLSCSPDLCFEFPTCLSCVFAFSVIMAASKRKRGGQKATAKRATKDSAKSERLADPDAHAAEVPAEENTAADPATESAPSPPIPTAPTQARSSTSDGDDTHGPSIHEPPAPLSPDAKEASQDPVVPPPAENPILPLPSPSTTTPTGTSKLHTQLSDPQSQTSALQTQLSNTYAQLNAKTALTPQSQSEPGSGSESDAAAKAEAILKRHIRLLHEYNEIKDVGLGLMGLIADARGVRLAEVMGEFDVATEAD